MLGEPNHSNGAENCVEMIHTETLNGRWNDANCDDTKPYYCSKQQDPSIKVGNELNNNKKCKKGWMQVLLVKTDSTTLRHRISVVP